MKVAVYARVSNADQHNAIQIRELTEHVERRGWELAGVYQDTMRALHFDFCSLPAGNGG